MYRVVEEKKDSAIISLDSLTELNLMGNIIVAEKGEIQDILVYTGDKYECWHWSSVYCRKVLRNNYNSIKSAIKSRLEKGMSVYVFSNRGEFRSFIKYNGTRE
jgi:hypothetical protein